MKVIIVGNGILGLSIAFRLLQKKRSIKIVIIGPVRREGGATPAAAAMLNSFAEVEHRSLDSFAGLKYFEASYISTREWPKFERELIAAAGDSLPKGCRDCSVEAGGCFSKGTYVFQNTTSDWLEDKNYFAIEKALGDFNEQYHQLHPSDIPGYNPSASKRALRALYIPGEGWLNPRLVLEKLERLLLASGNVTFVDDEVTGLRTDGKQFGGALLQSGKTVDCDAVVVAAGAFSSTIFNNSGLEHVIQPIFSAVGISIEVGAVSNVGITNAIRSPNRGGGCGIYVVPLFHSPTGPFNRYIIGASSVVSADARYHGRAVSVAHLLNSAATEVSQSLFSSEVIRVNVGNRPISLDQYPLIGRVEGSNLWVATATKRDGFHNAPLISEFIGSGIVGEHFEKFDFAAFRPDRKLIVEERTEQSIDYLIDVKMNEAYQHGFIPSNESQLGMVRDSWRRILDRFYDAVPTNIGAIHPQMLPIYKDVADGRASKHVMYWIQNGVNPKSNDFRPLS